MHSTQTSIRPYTTSLFAPSSNRTSQHSENRPVKLQDYASPISLPLQQTSHRGRNSISQNIPPIGLSIVTIPADGLFEMYLDGKLSAERLVGLELKSDSIQNDKQVDRQYKAHMQQREKSNASWDAFKKLTKVVEDVIAVSPTRSQFSGSDSPNKRSLDKSPMANYGLKKSFKFEDLTVEYRDQSPSLRHQRAIEVKQPQKIASQQVIKPFKGIGIQRELLFLKRCERLQGDKLTLEEEQLLLKPEKTERDLWEIVKRFHRKKWFFDMLYGQQQPRLGFIDGVQIEQSWVNKLKQIIERRVMSRKKPAPKDPILSKLENNIKSVQSIVERRLSNGDLLQSHEKKYYAHEASINRNLQQVQIVQDRNWDRNQVNIKAIIEDAIQSRSTIKGQFRVAADKYLRDGNKNSNGKLLEAVYGFDFDTDLASNQLAQHHRKQLVRSRQRNQTPSNEYRNIKRNERLKSLSNSQLSYASQNESFPSVTEVQLHNLYRETYTLQRQFKRQMAGKRDEKLDEPMKAQKKVRTIIKIGSVQRYSLNFTISDIMGVVNSKLACIKKKPSL